jgi:hypothetical protein
METQVIMRLVEEAGQHIDTLDYKVQERDKLLNRIVNLIQNTI